MNYKMKLVSLIILILLASCPGKTITFISEIEITKNAMKQVKADMVKKFKPTVDVDAIEHGASKYCYGIDYIDSPLFFCFKDNKVIILSMYYKYADSNNPFDLRIFHKSEKHELDQEAYEMHLKVVDSIKKELAINQNELLVDTNKSWVYMKDRYHIPVK